MADILVNSVSVSATSVWAFPTGLLHVTRVATEKHDR